MSGEQACRRRCHVTKLRAHDYIYDSAFIVSGARDFARTAFKAAMDSAQVVIQPVYNTMFSELRKFPRVHFVYHPNCRLPNHIDRSYSGYLSRTTEQGNLPTPQLDGRHRFMFSAMPKQVLPLKSATPDFQPPEQIDQRSLKPITRATQTIYRESSAQTHPWQPDGRKANSGDTTPEVLHLDKIRWGPGSPYRLGDLPVDFHTTEIINKMRHARAWNGLIEKGENVKGTKKRDAIISDVETRDWIFRETEIDELQDIRLALLHKLQSERRERRTSRCSTKLEKLWLEKKEQMAKKIASIHRTRDREVRKLEWQHSIGGRVGLSASLRVARGGGDMSTTLRDSVLHAPPTRNGYHARGRHAQLTYDLSLLEAEDHEKLSALPPWLEQCSQNLQKTCSGHHLPKNLTKLCERETKWSEKYLENLHNDLIKARLGTSTSPSGPILKARTKTRPDSSGGESVHQLLDECCPSVLIQRVVKGRAVQNLMYEGRSRATELISELKSTHGLQTEDKLKIAEEEAKARSYEEDKRRIDKKEAAISALVEELCGAAVSSALNFLDQELSRLREERRQHAFILVALRERTMREAAEAGRRQKEEKRREEHDEMFKQVIGVTQETIDAYLKEIIESGVNDAATKDAEAYVIQEADKIDAALSECGALSPTEQNDLVAELVHQFLLPEAHKAAAREQIDRIQRSKMAAARSSIFGVLDDTEDKDARCNICGNSREEPCRCQTCPVKLEAVENPEYRNDPRWKHTTSREVAPEKSISEKFPPYAEFRCMINTIIDEAVMESRHRHTERREVQIEYGDIVKENFEISIEAKSIIERCIDEALGLLPAQPEKEHKYHHYMKREIKHALDRSLHDECKYAVEKDRSRMLPSELRVLEDMTRCKCDVTAPTPTHTDIDLQTLAEESEPSDTTDYFTGNERTD